MTLRQFHSVLCAWFRAPCRLRFDDGQVVAERWPGAAPEDYQAVAELAGILSRGLARHPGETLYLLTLPEIDSLLTAIQARQVVVESGFRQGDGSLSEPHLRCNPFGNHSWRLEYLVQAYDTAVHAFSVQTGRPTPQNSQEIVEWLHEVRDALRDEFQGQLEPCPETGLSDFGCLPAS
jgi:hypothetical protein